MKLFIRIPVPLKPFLAIYMETAKILSDHPGVEARIEFINGHVDLQLMASQWLTWEIRDLGIVFLYGALPRARRGALETIGGIEEGMDG